MTRKSIGPGYPPAPDVEASSRAPAGSDARAALRSAGGGCTGARRRRLARRRPLLRRPRPVRDGDPRNDVAVDRSAKGAFHGGDLAGLTAQLDEIAALGVTAIWITPVVKNIDGFVTGAGFPDWGYHGYWADDFTRLDPRFGTEAELQRAREGGARARLKVLLDVVYNHAGYGSQYLTDPKTKDWLRSNELGTAARTTSPPASPGCPTSRPSARRSRSTSSTRSSAGRSGAASTASGSTRSSTSTTRSGRSTARATREELEARLLPPRRGLGRRRRRCSTPGSRATSWTPASTSRSRAACSAFSRAAAARSPSTATSKSREQVRPATCSRSSSPRTTCPARSSSSAATSRLFRLAAVLQFTTLGLPTIYYGEEVGRLGGDWPENRSDMPWGEHGRRGRSATRLPYRTLIAIRRAHPALSRGTHGASSPTATSTRSRARTRRRATG